ncbi:MAG: thioredoxin [Planctomycetota bacterium]|nr:MAG: thioredoxin [Planctomycetota bacterium]
MKLFNNTVGALLIFAFAYLCLMPTQPPNDPWFQSVVVQSSRPVLVKFGAEWCPPCQAMEPVLDDLASQMSSQVKVIRIDVDQMPQLASHYGVSSIPRLILFKNGKVIADRKGFHDTGDMKQWINRSL